MTRVVTAVLAVLLSWVALAPVAAGQPGVAPPSVDLRITATVSQQAYYAGQDVVVEVSIANLGTADATDVVVRSEGDLALGPLGTLEPGLGVRLMPGDRMDLTLSAPANDTGDGMTQHLAVVGGEPDLNPADNEATVFAFVTEKQSDLDLTVFADADRDGVIDAGETRGGVQVTLRGGLSYTNVTARTNDLGVVHFTGISGGVYYPDLVMPGGWYMDPYTLVNVRGGADTAKIQLLPDNISALQASVSLDKDSYDPRERVRERVTLTNTGTTDIHGVVAFCGGYGAGQVENALFSTGWGDLFSGSAGVTVAAGETRTWEFTDVVPALAWNYGHVFLRCDFSRQGNHNGPVAEDRAAVPGGHGVIEGTVTTAEGTPLPGVTLLMLNTTGGVAARVVSGPDGRFQFPELPANEYELRPVGPWRLFLTVYVVQVKAGLVLGFDPLVLLPGPYQNDPDEVRPPPPVVGDPPPTPQASPRPANLADTGADAAELIALGALLVVAGALLRRGVA